MPAGHDCEDDECVDGSASISAAAVLSMFLGLEQLYLRTNTDWNFQ